MKIKKTLTTGIHIISIPSGIPVGLEEIFPKEISGSTIELLENEQWKYKEKIYFQNNRFAVSKHYKKLQPLTTLRLALKREIEIVWDISFKSYSGLKLYNPIFREGFQLNEALLLAQLSSLVYEDKKVVEKILKENYDFDHFEYYSKQNYTLFKDFGWFKSIFAFFKRNAPLVDLQFLILSKKDKTTNITTYTIIFRGSQEPQDWITNFSLKYQLFLNNQKKGKVHGGFYKALTLFFHTLKTKKKILKNKEFLHDIQELKNAKFLIAGHSLGGALATLLGCYLYEKGLAKENFEIYTFGAPPIGTKQFVQEYESKIKLFRVVNEDDIVPKLDKITKLSHFGEKIVLESNEGEIHTCDGYIDNIIDAIAKQEK